MLDFELGVDFVFDGGYLDKIAVHTNVVPHFMFGRYEKCIFDIENSNLSPDSSNSLSQNHSNSAALDYGAEISTGTSTKSIVNWLDLQAILGPPSSQPIISNPSNQPFKSTHWYEYPSSCLGVEIVKDQLVATVVFWRPT